MRLLYITEKPGKGMNKMNEMNTRNLNLADLLQEDECIVRIDGEFLRNSIRVIAPYSAEGVNINQISGCLEETLHRIIGNGGTSEDVFRILGASQNDPGSSDLSDGLIWIDLGYAIPAYFFEAGINTEVEERKLSRQEFLKYVFKKNPTAWNKTAKIILTNAVDYLYREDDRFTTEKEKQFALMDILDGTDITLYECSWCALN